MTRIMNRKMTCFICGKQSEYHVLLSTNFSGSPDLDLRRHGMGRSTIGEWVHECPHCGYVNSSVEEKTVVSAEFFNSYEYVSCDGLRLPSKTAKKYYRLYMLRLRENDYDGALYAITRAAWACDDASVEGLAMLCREKAVEIIENHCPPTTEEEFCVYADTLRRCGRFSKVIEILTDFPAEDLLIKQIMAFQVKLSHKKDMGVYTVEDACGA